MSHNIELPVAELGSDVVSTMQTVHNPSSIKSLNMGYHRVRTNMALSGHLNASMTVHCESATGCQPSRLVPTPPLPNIRPSSSDPPPRQAPEASRQEHLRRKDVGFPGRFNSKMSKCFTLLLQGW